MIRKIGLTLIAIAATSVFLSVTVAGVAALDLGVAKALEMLCSSSQSWACSCFWMLVQSVVGVFLFLSGTTVSMFVAYRCLAAMGCFK